MPFEVKPMKNWIHCLLAAAMLALALLSGCGAGNAEEAPAFTVDFLSTGKSDCALIRMDGLVILSDAAETDDYETIARCMKRYGIKRIDCMILSHFDKDHIGAAAALIRNYDVTKVLCPDYHEYSDEYYALLDAVGTTAGTEGVVLTADFRIETENGSVLADPADTDYGDDNNDSIITTVTYRGHSLIFMGDAMKKRLEEFENVMGESCELVKLPHHGDSSKPLLRIMKALKPAWAVETVTSQKNVDPDLLACLQAQGTTLYCTCDGPIHVEWDGEKLIAEQ